LQQAWSATDFGLAERLLTLKAPRIIEPMTSDNDSEQIILFNGVDLNGWDYSDDGNINWSVQNGSIVGKSVQPVLTSTYCLTKQHFTDFRLFVTVKLAESEMHSGIALWGHVPAPHHGSDHHTYAGHLVMFPSSWSMFDLLPDPVNAGQHVGRSMIFYDPGVARRVGHQHGWNELEILARGNRVQVVCNGSLIVDYVDDMGLDAPSRRRVGGPIGLQLHSNSVPQQVRLTHLSVLA
jgi:hypothetical protein